MSQMAASPEAWAAMCPYLLEIGGTWRAVRPSSVHRCMAQSPPASLSADQQRAVCLVRAHAECPWYTRARASRARQLGAAAQHLPTAAWVPARTAPIVLEPYGSWRELLALLRTSLPQIALAILMMLAAIALVLARLTSA